MAALGGRSTAVRPARGTLREINGTGEYDCTATSIHLRVPGATKNFHSPRLRNTCILDKDLVPYSMSRFFGGPTDLKSSSIWYDATPFFWTR